MNIFIKNIYFNLLLLLLLCWIDVIMKMRCKNIILMFDALTTILRSMCTSRDTKGHFEGH